MNGDRSPTAEGAEDLRDRFERVAPVILVDPGPVVRRGRRRRAITGTGAGAGAVVAVLAVALLLRPDGGLVGPAVSTPPPPEQTRPVAIQVVPEVVAPGGVVTAVLVASEENDLVFGVAAEVERWDGSGWRPAGAARLCLVDWDCIGTVTGRLGGVEDIGLTAALGTPGSATVLSTDGLGDGWYRLVQRASPSGAATGVFEVRSGADAAPPLPAQDGVRLTVDPALVPPGAGLVRVVTHVPAGADGTLTAEDIQAADSTLDASALVQRWDGRGWVDVVDVRVQQREPDLGVEWGSPLALPPLEEGSYRLIRTAADGSTVWGVFTVTSSAPALDRPPAGETREPDLGADGDTPAEDVYAPDHPFCQERPGRCLLETWWRDVVAQAQIERAGGDHDIGLVLTDSVRMAGQRYLVLTLFPAEAAPQSPGLLAVEGTTQLGEVEVEAGEWDDGADGRRLTCGGFVLHARSTELTASEIDHIVGLIAGALIDCPADVAALAARYPQMPPLP